MKDVVELIDTQNYILSCIAKILACICEGSSIGMKEAGIIADEMDKFLSNRDVVQKEGAGE